MIKLMPHQAKAVRELRNGCILKGPTGSGKTLTALFYYGDQDPVERLIVITTAKKRDTGDWEAEGRFLGIYPEVDSWQNIAKYEDVSGAFFIFDEQRIVGSGAWVKSFLKITKTNQWILLSATPGDSWLDYIPVFVANGFYRNRSEFLREHVIFAPYVRYPKVLGYRGTERLKRYLSSIMVDMPFKRQTTRKEAEIWCEYKLESYNVAWKRRWNEAEKRPIRNASELFSILRKVVNSDPSRLAAVREIMLAHPKVIIFYNFDYELEILRGLDTLTAEWNGHKHEGIPEKEFGRWAYLVQYASGAEAWGCTETDTMIFYSLTYSYRMFEQAKGRIDRLDTSFDVLNYFMLLSGSVAELAIKASLAKKKDFNETAWLRSGASL